MLTAGDLDADGHDEIIVGTAGGGLRLLRAPPTGLGLAADAAGPDGATLDVFPNPATTACAVALHPTDGRPDQLAALTLRDALGRVVRHGPASGQRHTVELAGLAPGLYVLTPLRRRAVFSCGG